MTQIKLCGLSRIQDIEAANALAPDYIGFVFANKSARYVSPETAGALRAKLAPGIKAVGVFVDESPETVAALVRDGIIDIAQLHGAEDEAYIAALRRLTDAPVIKAFRLGSTGELPPAEAEKQREAQLATLREAASCSADFVLLDSGAGTGTTLPWELLRDFPKKYFLAGGLAPENAAEAVRMLHPAAVDVSSGIETGKVKDAAKMRAFVNAVRKEEGYEQS